MEICDECNEAVEGRAISVSDGRIFHREHFRCYFCQLQIHNFYYWEKVDGQKVAVCDSCKCERNHPKCKQCDKVVDETFIQVRKHAYHLNCFLCQRCRQPFSGGEYYEYKNKCYDLDCFWVVRLMDGSE